MSLTKSTRLVLYAMPDTRNPDGHPFLVGHSCRKNKKDRYVLDGQFMSLGLFWPHGLAQGRKELAETLGTMILDQLGI